MEIWWRISERVSYAVLVSFLEASGSVERRDRIEPLFAVVHESVIGT